MRTRAKSVIVKPKVWGFFVAETTVDVAVSEPLTVKDALQFDLWKKAMDEEMPDLAHNQTWRLVPPPPPNLNLIDIK